MAPKWYRFERLRTSMIGRLMGQETLTTARATRVARTLDRTDSRDRLSAADGTELRRTRASAAKHGAMPATHPIAVRRDDDVPGAFVLFQNALGTSTPASAE